MMVQRGEIHISKRRSEIHSKKSGASFLVEVALLNSVEDSRLDACRYGWRWCNLYVTLVPLLCFYALWWSSLFPLWLPCRCHRVNFAKVAEIIQKDNQLMPFVGLGL